MPGWSSRRRVVFHRPRDPCSGIGCPSRSARRPCQGNQGRGVRVSSVGGGGEGPKRAYKCFVCRESSWHQVCFGCLFDQQIHALFIVASRASRRDHNAVQQLHRAVELFSSPIAIYSDHDCVLRPVTDQDVHGVVRRAEQLNPAQTGPQKTIEPPPIVWHAATYWWGFVALCGAGDG